jgi:hypothetical protein
MADCLRFVADQQHERRFAAGWLVPNVWRPLPQF